jgi:phosphate starvation-inducible protein PhoH and related proteins
LSRKNRTAAQPQASKQQQRYTENTIPFESPTRSRREVSMVPKTLTQEKYILALNDTSKNIVVAYGPAGTGKTYLAMLGAIKALRSGECSRIVLTRPAVGVEEEHHGFLPGTLDEKMEPWCRPLFDVLREYYTQREILKMLDEQTVEISPLAFMRGRSMKNSWIIADEMQNSTANQCLMLLTRLGENCKVIVTGDLNQRDRKFKTDNGLEDFIDRVKSDYRGDRISLVQYTQQDVQRHPVIQEVLKLYKQE